MKVVISNIHLQEDFDNYRHIFDEHGIEVVLPDVNERLSEGELLSLMGDVDGVICGDDDFNRTVLNNAPKLKVISKWGTGTDSIDKSTCRELGILVCNTPNAFTNEVADTAMGFILTLARGILDSDKYMHMGVWKKVPGKALRELTLGIIGVGNIGKAVARRANAFGMVTIGYDKVEIPRTFLQQTGMVVTTKMDLLRSCDFVTLHCDLNPTSYHIIGHLELDKMKSTAYLINTARGPLVNEDALIKALDHGKIAGAALDVFENEPLDPASPLTRMSNVLLSSHNANTGTMARKSVHTNSIRNLLEGMK